MISWIIVTILAYFATQSFMAHLETTNGTGKVFSNFGKTQKTLIAVALSLVFSAALLVIVLIAWLLISLNAFEHLRISLPGWLQRVIDSID